MYVFMRVGVGVISSAAVRAVVVVFVLWVMVRWVFAVMVGGRFGCGVIVVMFVPCFLCSRYVCSMSVGVWVVGFM
ncbi:MAG: hypothetical protein DRN04_16840 [Thermoprotei archaeon]|nr:MAG: hypothetical protein DRN04_16840 [Thermoprotei archaeon]